MIFLDIACPICGKIIGNGGIGNDAYCPSCGYAGTIRLDKRDIEALNEIIQRHLEQNREDAHET